MASGSYTVAFGDLKISVNSNGANESSFEDDCSSAPQSTLSDKDSAVLREMRKNKTKQEEKLRSKNPNYWDKRHDTKKTKPAGIRPPKKSNNAKYAKIPCEGCNNNGELNDTTFESMPDSVKSMITVDDFDASGHKKLWDCMDDQNEKSATHVEQFFFGSVVNPSKQVLCWYCSHLISLSSYRVFPKFCPYKYHPVNKYFLVKGYFCSWECVRGYALSSHASMVPLLAHMLKLLFGRYVKIRCLFKRTDLIVFGGTMNRQEQEASFHNCNSERITHKLQWHPEFEGCVRIKV